MVKFRPGNPENCTTEQDDNAKLQAVQTRELYQGPIPHPDILKKFGAVDPSYPERIMKMAEENNRLSLPPSGICENKPPHS
jgi:uncharacterized membrane protein